ncbi:YidB family protein [Embleya sp. NPDC008237]|uniref:YidB family protein n=1 Tax=Embleya sp. NPDC008237 TaxID=3363978 RepID=UPI0036E7A1FC
MTNEDGVKVEPTILTISAERLAGAGLESQVRSWIGEGPNEPITAGQVVAVIGEDQLAQTAATLGKTPGDLAADLAAELPELVDAAAPDPESAPTQGRNPGLQIRIAPTSGLTLDNEAAIDGSVTLTLNYL